MSIAVASPDRVAQVEGLDDFTPAETAEQRKARRHPAEVTADRISEHIAAYSDHLTPREVVALDHAHRVLTQMPGRIRAAGGDDQ